MSENNAGAIDPQTGHAGNAQTGKPFEHAPEHAHDRLDKTDERSLANNLADAARVEKKEKEAEEAKAAQKPTDAAKSHGNAPSKGAKVDEELEKEDEERLAQKDQSAKDKKN